MARRGKRRQPKPSIVGKTTEGVSVIDGTWVFFLGDAQGMSLCDVLDFCYDNECMVDWVGYIRAARKHGWDDKTIIPRVREASTDVYGRDWFSSWLEIYESVM